MSNLWHAMMYAIGGAIPAPSIAQQLLMSQSFFEAICRRPPPDLPDAALANLLEASLSLSILPICHATFPYISHHDSPQFHNRFCRRLRQAAPH